MKVDVSAMFVDVFQACQSQGSIWDPILREIKKRKLPKVSPSKMAKGVPGVVSCETSTL